MSKYLRIEKSQAAKLLVIVQKIENMVRLSPNLASISGWSELDGIEVKRILENSKNGNNHE